MGELSMADIKVLMVLDGGRLNFGPLQPGADADYFGISVLLDALRDGSTTPTFQVDTAHRRGGTFNSKVTGAANAQDDHEDCSVGLTYQGDFVFTGPVQPGQVTADLSQYDVLWIIVDEGYNAGSTGTAQDSQIGELERLAIMEFMEAGGGVFAVGDHDGIGSYACGELPRIRLMRRWWEYNQATQLQDPSGQTLAPNWSAEGDAASSPVPDRNDTLQPDSSSTPGNDIYCFNDQSDANPQPLLTQSGQPLDSTPALVHSILRGADGTVIAQFPDHMHEGEATDFSTVSGTNTPFNPNQSNGQPFQVSFTDAQGNAHSYDEFPIADGIQPAPTVIAYTHDSGHATYNQGDTTLGEPSFGPSSGLKGPRGAISVYDGRPAGRGRIITGSTFHHYLDKNLAGDPGTAGTGPGTDPTGTDTGLPAAARGPITQYYINAATWLTPVNPSLQIWTIKSQFGADEVLDAPGGFPDSFYVVIDGYPADAFNVASITLSGPFAAAATIDVPGTVLTSGPGRTIVAFTVKTIASSAFPPAGSMGTNELLLEARLNINGEPQAAEALFQLTAGAAPYFTNVNGLASPPNVYYLSQDLRVFQVCPGIGQVPAMVPWPASGSGYDYIQAMIGYLNDPGNGYTTGADDPFQVLNEAGDLVDYSSVAPVDKLPGGGTTPNYNFAIARVRLRGGTASNVRVFFRLFDTVSNDTDYDPVVTYPSTSDAAGLPATPLPGLFGCTIPMFATVSGASDFAATLPLNARELESTGAETWAYFGCYLDINFNVILIGTHHCLVAQIAFDGTPIINSNGVTLSPESTSLLAQRNLQVTASGNPGGPAAHRVPQTLDLRTSTRTAEPASVQAGRPDELMIDWGETPHGAVASMYWPAAAAIDVVRLASMLYPDDPFYLADANTVSWTVTSRFSFVPIPFGADVKLAGLLTVDLPAGIRAGQQFTVVVRRISTRRAPVRKPDAAALVNQTWRYLVGTVQIDIPVSMDEHLLPCEENTLAIMKWRLGQLSPTDRWYPVMVRYVSYLEGRVNAFGGNAADIVPSPLGMPSGHGRPGQGRPGHGRLNERTGKVSRVTFDCFGDLDGFDLRDCPAEHRYLTRERGLADLLLRACRERWLVTVVADGQYVRQIVVRE
jgi:hypothetical protein